VIPVSEGLGPVARSGTRTVHFALFQFPLDFPMTLKQVFDFVTPVAGFTGITKE
jgi:hypothetical protein